MFSFFKRSSVPNYQYQDPALWRDIFTRKQKRKNDVEVPEFKHLPVFDNEPKVPSPQYGQVRASFK